MLSPLSVPSLTEDTLSYKFYPFLKTALPQHPLTSPGLGRLLISTWVPTSSVCLLPPYLPILISFPFVFSS